MGSFLFVHQPQVGDTAEDLGERAARRRDGVAPTHPSERGRYCARSRTRHGHYRTIFLAAAISTEPPGLRHYPSGQLDMEEMDETVPPRKGPMRTFSFISLRLQIKVTTRDDREELGEDGGTALHMRNPFVLSSGSFATPPYSNKRDSAQL